MKQRAGRGLLNGGEHVSYNILIVFNINSRFFPIKWRAGRGRLNVGGLVRGHHPPPRHRALDPRRDPAAFSVGHNYVGHSVVGRDYVGHN